MRFGLLAIAVVLPVAPPKASVQSDLPVVPVDPEPALADSGPMAAFSPPTDAAFLRSVTTLRRSSRRVRVVSHAHVVQRVRCNLLDWVH
jgi:hypothetical protein